LLSNSLVGGSSGAGESVNFEMLFTAGGKLMVPLTLRISYLPQPIINLHTSAWKIPLYIIQSLI